MHSMVEMRRPACEPARPDWRGQAMCLEEDPDLFFPDGATSPAVVEQVREAKLVCAGCPVREQCLRWALDTGQEWGVWGGWDEDERRALRWRQQRARKAVA